jgi:hypothetical protein
MKVVRIFNVFALGALIGVAGVAYRVKYDATLHAEEVAKLKRSIERERDSMSVLKAEIARRTRPDRIQSLAERNLQVERFTTAKLTTPADLPEKPVPVDLIAQKLEMLGVGGQEITGKVTPRPQAAKSKEIKKAASR